MIPLPVLFHTPSRRLPDWPQRLSALVLQRRGQPFQLGVRDCCLWAADAVQAVTGADPARPVRGSYGGPRQALGLLRSLGGLRGVGALAGRPIALGAALEGDVALVRQAGRPMLAVCAARQWLVVSNVGLFALPWDAPLQVWGVAHD